MMRPAHTDGRIVADDWKAWCGDCAWTHAMRQFGELGGLVDWWCGYPQCCSAIPLTFALFAPDGSELPCRYRLKDIRAAIATLSPQNVNKCP